MHAHVYTHTHVCTHTHTHTHTNDGYTHAHTAEQYEKWKQLHFRMGTKCKHHSHAYTQPGILPYPFNIQCKDQRGLGTYTHTHTHIHHITYSMRSLHVLDDWPD